MRAKAPDANANRHETLGSRVWWLKLSTSEMQLLAWEG
jgi:hypothetical protein